MRKNDYSKAKYTAICESDSKRIGECNSIRMLSMHNNLTDEYVDMNKRSPSCLSFRNIDDLKESLGWCFDKKVETKFGPTSNGKTILYVYLLEFE